MKYDYNRVSDNLDAVQVSGSPGTVIAANAKTDPATFGCTLANAVTYVFPFGDERAPVPSLAPVIGAHLRWDNAIAFTATIEECGFPARWPSDQAQGVADVSDFSTTAGNWIPIKPAAGYVEVTGGGTYTPATGVIAVAAAQQGGCTINLSLWGGRRLRVKIVVGGTGGLVRCALNGKGVT